jgi:hypothetical protein
VESVEGESLSVGAREEAEISACSILFGNDSWCSELGRSEAITKTSGEMRWTRRNTRYGEHRNKNAGNGLHHGGRSPRRERWKKPTNAKRDMSEENY